MAITFEENLPGTCQHKSTFVDIENEGYDDARQRIETEMRELAERVMETLTSPALEQLQFSMVAQLSNGLITVNSTHLDKGSLNSDQTVIIARSQQVIATTYKRITESQPTNISEEDANGRWRMFDSKGNEVLTIEPQDNF